MASANTLIGIHVGIGEGGIIVTFWSAWNVILFKTPEINKKYIYIYMKTLSQYKYKYDLLKNNNNKINI